MLPKNTQTYFLYLDGAGTHTITENPSTVLGYAFTQSNVSSDTDLMCGNEILFRNFSKDVCFIPANYYCTTTLQIIKTGNDEASVSVSYYPGNYNEIPGSSLYVNAEMRFLLCVIIFFLSIMAWKIFFKPFRNN